MFYYFLLHMTDLLYSHCNPAYTEFPQLCLFNKQIYYVKKRVYPKDGPKDVYILDYDIVEAMYTDAT